MVVGMPSIRPVDRRRWAPFRFINDAGYPVVIMDSTQEKVAELTTALIYHSMRK